MLALLQVGGVYALPKGSYGVSWAQNKGPVLGSGYSAERRPQFPAYPHTKHHGVER